jgi:hypothetical protein
LFEPETKPKPKQKLKMNQTLKNTKTKKSLTKNRLNAEKIKNNLRTRRTSKVNPTIWIPNQTIYNQKKDIDAL